MVHGSPNENSDKTKEWDLSTQVELEISPMEQLEVLK